ncbi:MAG: hypothetical protein BHW01_06000 [Clostridium sp. 27_14]|nr:MAG: hypothetical protein BHW01_06000 [Clostridium sp. 27_14]
MNLKKNVFKEICIFIIILLILSTSVMANNDQQVSDVKQYNLEKIGMKISLQNNFIDIIESMKNNDEKVSDIENKDEYLKNYKNSGVLLDAVDNIESPSKEILVVCKTSNNYIDMANFNEFSDEEKNAYKEKLLETFEEQEKQSQSEKTKFSIKENSILKTDNGNNFINIKTSLEKEEKVLEMSIYYTIVNGRLVTISFRNYQKEDQEMQEQEKQVMENIEFYEVERPQAVATNQTMQLALGFTTIVFIILAIIVIMFRIKDRKYLDKNIKDVKIKQYSKFGGLVLFFWTLCFYQFFLRIVEISNVSKIDGMDFYVGAITIQNTILAIVNMYQIYLTVKRKPETPKRLVKTNILVMLIGVIITIVRIIYALIKPMEIYDKEYFKQELITLVYSVIYPLICIFYFKFSKRVQTYYYLKIKE